MGEPRKLCTFRIDDHLFGLDIQHVQEVLCARDVTPVPPADSAVRGLINLRGHVVTVLDPRALLGTASSEESEPLSGRREFHVVCRYRDDIVSFVVDRIDDVIEVGDFELEDPPVTMSSVAKESCRGVYKLAEELLFVLDIEALVAVPAT